MEKGTGVIIGKFMPPHLGHQYLVDFARHFVSDVTVLVCTLPNEPIAGELRYAWMHEMCPNVTVVHVTDENPQEPHEHPDFWNIWKQTIKSRVPQVDYVFASEAYGWQLAKVLGARYIPVDHARALVPISGTTMREKPLTHWQYLPACVRPYFAKRVCIFGPESSGKSTLAQNLARHFNTVYVAEYARGLLDFKDGRCDYEDIETIAHGQIASEDALARQANRVLFADTDLIMTTIWSDILFGKCPPWIQEVANQRLYDLYLVLSPEVTWVADAQRYQPDIEERRRFLGRCLRELGQRGRKYVVIDGNWDERSAKAIGVVQTLLTQETLAPR